MRLGNTNEPAKPPLFKRPPYHVCVIKTIYAKGFKFPTKGKDAMHGEDWIWMEQVLRSIKSETHIDMILHNYNYSTKWSRGHNK